MSGTDFGDVHLEIRNGVALLTLKALEGSWSWGTLRLEHRWNPVLVSDFSSALDAVEADSTAEALVVSNEGRYWSNGMDLRYLDSCSNEEQSKLQRDTNQLMARVCCFPLPTVAAFKGHWCAAGGMMGLAFDFRVMASDSGYFFIPGVDLGLVYSPMQMALMKAKLPPNLHRDVILFNLRRWTASELLVAGAIDAAELQQMVLLKIRPPTLFGLQGILRKLSTHHSRDPKFLAVIRREIRAAMSRQEQSYPWRCQCGSLNGKRAVHCPLCAMHWTSGVPHSKQPKKQSGQSNSSTKWNQRSGTPRQNRYWSHEADTEAHGQWVKSPRRQASRPRSASNRAKQNKGKGRGKSKGGQMPIQFQSSADHGATQGPPAVLPTYQEAPWLMAPPPTELQHANAARLSLHSSWRTFLVEQVSKWQAYSQQFQQQEATLSDRVAAARAALETARTNLAVSKSLLQKSDQSDPQDITTVSDEEEESKESKEAANSSAQKITDSLQHLGESLKTLSANADEMMLAEQQANKRQRIDPPAPANGGAASGDGDVSFP
ncbi:unnamed protein product [Cladocopium goreaui]|uniref:Enoyl-CoA hydratase/isomerase YngF n=1 Tax=Cladocopium goreaui TaxID=2562237 RepID=A0A9P1G6S7_9DINO|nr:unnamed protein product [Cladocopium goreaui]